MKATILILCMLALFSCNEENAATIDPINEISSALQNSSAARNNSTYLCKINGEDWHYTKASGLVFIEKTTDIKMAMITFKKKLEKGSETIQLEYNVENNSLHRVLVQLKKPNKENKRITAFYNATTETISRIPRTQLSGTVDVSNTSTASGTANFKVEVSYEKETLKNEQDIFIHVSDLSFSGVGYSDLNKTFD